MNEARNARTERNGVIVSVVTLGFVAAVALAFAVLAILVQSPTVIAIAAGAAAVTIGAGWLAWDSIRWGRGER